MKKQILLPRACRMAGLVLFPLSILHIVARYFWNFRLPVLYKHVITRDGRGMTDTFYYDYTQQAGWLFVIVTLFMAAFSKLKVEDEYVRSVRLNSLLASIYIYALAYAFITVFSVNIFFVFVLANVIPLMLIFIIVFNFNLYILPRFSKTAAV